MLARPPRLVPGLLTFAIVASVLYVLRSYEYIPPPGSIRTLHFGPPSVVDTDASASGRTGVTVDPNSASFSRVLVIPKTKDDDIGWIAKELPDEKVVVYEVDNPNPTPPYLRVPRNRGREANVYITYIIDHYDDLPDIVLFFHAHRFAWHNNWLLDLDTANTIRRLNNQRVARLGYMNSRCQYEPGCFDWIHLDRPEVDFDDVHKPEERGFKKEIWREVYPDVPPPPALSQPCCAQFAVTRDRIRSRPKSQYEHFRNWLYNTPLDEQWSGRFFEYTWQYVFTGYTELCPVTHSCLCDGFGVCFGNGDRLAKWWDLRQRRDKLQDEVKRLGEGEETRAEREDKIKQIAGMDQELQRQKAEAYRRGQDPKLRMQEVERQD